MHPAYLKTQFRTQESVELWPQEFVIVTAYATTGTQWPPEQNEAADRRLESELRGRGGWLVRLTGFSPSTGHAEPGWAFEMPFEEACDLGLRYLQDAIYHVTGDELSVSFCDDRRKLVPVDSFRERLHFKLSGSPFDKLRANGTSGFEDSV